MTNNKYNLRLEQLVQTTSFGNLLISISYDPEGPKIVSVYGGNIEQNLRQNLDTVLKLINFTLLKKIKTREVAEQILNKPQGYKNLPLDELLAIVAQALQDAPENVSRINPNILQELFVGAQKDIQKAEKISTARSEEERVNNQVPQEIQLDSPIEEENIDTIIDNPQEKPNEQPQGKFFNPFRDKRE